MRKKTKNVLQKLGLLLVLLVSLAGFTQAQTIKGTVTGTDGLGIPGVNVIVKGTTNGTITNMDGAYQLNVNTANAVLEFRFIGYQSEEVTVGNLSIIDVVLKEDTELIEDVVVVGFGQQKKESVVGSIVQAKGDEILKAGAVQTVSEALAGLLPGVAVTQRAGQPGATQADILIRGKSSWTDNSPLYLVDGVERDFNDLDPNEIESVSVLKDASATAVFGLKAANGVILVTTKKGQAGKPVVSFTGNWGVKIPTVEYDYIMDYSKILEHYNVAAKNDYQYGLMRPQSLINTWADPNRDRDFYSYTFWPEYLIDKGESQQYNINISGGNKLVKYFTSFGYNYDGDVFALEKLDEFDPRTYQRKYSWRSNLDFQFTKTTKFSVKLSGDFKDWNGNRISNAFETGVGSEVQQGLGQQFNFLFAGYQVGAPPVLSNGELGILGGTSDKSTILGDMQYDGQNMKCSSRIYTDFILEQDITKYIKFSGKLSLNYLRSYKSNIWVGELIYYYPDYADMVMKVHGDPDRVPDLPVYSAESLSGYNKSLYYDFRLTYNRKIEDHAIHALALFSRREYTGGVSFPKREESWVARATYGYKDKYLMEFNGAYNGNENWAPGLKFGFFPSGAIGWNVSEENFMKESLPFIEFMKLKYSYGLVGSSAGIGNNRFTYISTFTSGRSVYFGTDAQLTGYGSLYGEGSPANPNNTWEKAYKQNLGLELTVLAGRLHADIDFFKERRTDILMQRRIIPPWFGNSAPIANLGETKNHGFDVSLKWNNKIGNDFRYWLTGNFSMSENRVVYRDDPPATEEYRKAAGKPISYQTGILRNGNLESWNDIYNTTSPLNPMPVIPGDFRYVDYNCDGVIDNNDMVPIGYPSYAANSYAFSLGLEYKNFSIHGMFNGVFNITKKLSDRYLWNDNEILTPDELDFWTPENLDAATPAPSLTPRYNTMRSDYNMRNSGFLRLRTVELKYKLDKETLKKLRYLERMEIFVNGHNLLTWSYLPKAFDPEAKELETYPITRRYNVGLRFSF